MNLQQASQARPSANGYGRRRQDREVGGGGAGGGARADHYRSQSSKIVSNRSSHAGGLVSRKIGGPSGDRLLYLATCLIGHPVEVQVKNGSLYTGIFHATNAEKDFGIILKMAHMSKDGTKGQKSDGGFLSKPPLKTLIIHANELVQIIAKDVPVTSDGFNEVPQEKQQELMLDSYISQSRQADGERVLEPWVPDEDDPHYPELDNTFDTRWNRLKWDQFETNEMLFGVKSTFNEELYTTKLERGPQTRELEKEASRIAREIEGEVTQDLHLAEERGLQLHEDFDVDEETRFSSVFRGRVADDSGYGEDEDILFNSRNTDTFGDSDAPITTGFSDGMTFEKTSTGVPPSGSCSVEDRKTYASVHQTDSHTSGILDQTRQPSSSVSCGTCTSAITGSRVQESSCSDLSGENDSKVQIMGQHLNVEAQTLQSGADSDAQSSANGKKDASDGGASSSGAVVHPSPSEGSLKDPEETRSTNDSERTASGKRTHAEPPVKTNQRPSSSRSSISDHVGATSSSIATGLTPSSSVGSLSSEKSTLNPNAKEFKLNPNAKSFVPSQTPVRPPSPVSDASFYVPTNMASVQHMHGMPAGVGITPQFVGHQPVIFNPQFPPIHSPQGYLHTSAPQQYGQHMMFGHPRQVPYMSSYPPVRTPSHFPRDAIQRKRLLGKFNG
ncbi:hypothetical protein SAY86_016732 [Trapa natans]|uniref:Sm domain-containing protein n=1 Tax=Trapa natans TaxID=22666 RepID=A0AAN7M056_TRANT|nr:hypothetical protein SAY86_016732 [Trapa natans]